jgi:heparan-alpha-glucosaminide N-acetyltransferase
MSTSPSPPPARVAAIDAYRGFVMFLMMAEVLHLGRMAKAFPDSPVWRFLALHQSHVEWTGCTLHDLIQPSFSFLVGVALPFSLASRVARGQRFGLMALHAAWRSLVLIALGIFLRSVGRPRTNFTFEDTLTQIGLGYFFLFLLGFVRPRWQWAAFVAVVVGYWAAFALYPLPEPGFDTRTVGVPADWPYHATGLAAHWDKNTNLAMDFDRWFLNLFPREKPFEYNDGGYATLSFIPTLGTMILGLIAGGWLRRDGSPWAKVALFTATGLVFLAAGLAAETYGVCPIVKRIWTPAWTLYSGGWCLLLLAGFYATTDAIGHPGWSFPLRVIGANSIAAYCMAHLIEGFIVSSFKTHLGKDVFKVFGDAYEPLVTGIVVLAVFWLILFWMYRRKIFLRI